MTFIATAIGGLAAGAGTALIGGLMGSGGGVGGNGLNSQADPVATANGLFNAYQQNAGGMYGLTSQYSPGYAQLGVQNFNAANNNMAGQIFNNSAIMQQGQNANNLQQANGQIDLLNQFGGQMNQAYQNANPQLQQLQNQYTQMATTQQNPVSQIQGAGQWGQQFAQQAGQMINGSQVNPYQISPQMQVGVGQNGTLNMANQNAQQQLALGGQISNQEASTVANGIMSNYNQMGRAEDPMAIAGLATGLDTYSQQRLQQREQNASTVAGQTTNQQGLGLSAGIANLGASQQSQVANQTNSLAAQQANLASQLGSAGLQYESLYGSSQQGLQSQLANQQAQLANANYQQQLMSGASNLAYTTGQQGYGALMSQSQGNNYALQGANLGLNNASQGQNLYQQYNPMVNNFNSAYGSNTQAAGNNASTNAGMFNGLSNIFTSPSSLSAINSGLGNMFGGSATGTGYNSGEAQAGFGWGGP